MPILLEEEKKLGRNEIWENYNRSLATFEKKKTFLNRRGFTFKKRRDQGRRKLKLILSPFKADKKVQLVTSERFWNQQQFEHMF